MERDEDAAEDGDEESYSPLELIEETNKALILRGQETLGEIRVTKRAYDQLEQECWPCTVEEYFDVPIFILGRH